MGVFTFRDGSTYSGFWRAGKKHGVGVFRPAALSASPMPINSKALSLLRSESTSKAGLSATSSMGGGRSAFADKAAEAAALPDEAAADVLSPTGAVRFGDFAADGTAGVKVPLEKQGSTPAAVKLQQQLQQTNQVASDTVLIKVGFG